MDYSRHKLLIVKSSSLVDGGDSVYRFYCVLGPFNLPVVRTEVSAQLPTIGIG